MNKIERTYYPDGQIKQEYETINGIKHGKLTLYFKNGRIKIESNYVQGQPEGIYKEWYENGQLAEEGENVNGDYFVKNFWDENGEQLLKDGNGKTIRKFGFSQGDIYEQYFVNGEFTGEKKIEGVTYGKFIPKGE